MTPAQLKKSLLQEAIMGKLVPQDPAEGTGEALYQQIQAEKEEQRKKKEKETGKKIRKEKPLPPITAEEIPFAIPENWKWVRLGEICEKICSGSTPSGGKNSGIYQEQGIPFFREQNIYNDGLTYDGIVYISSKLSDTRPRSKFYAKDLLLNITGGSIGRCAIVPDDFQVGDINQHILIIRLINSEIRKYIHTFICSPLGQMIINQKSVGAKAGFSAVKCKNMIIPLPPLAEQKRIVAKLDELQLLVKEYAAAYDKLRAYEAKFPEDLKKSILQEALMGKLVPQDPAEGTGEALYLQIQQEKEEQRKKKEKETGKKIRKEKPLPPIMAEEIPFEIPENWKWVRLGEIVAKEIKRGKSPTYAIKSDVLVFAQKCNTKANTIDLSLAKYLDKDKFTTYPESEYLQNQDILINSTGTGTLGRVGIFHDVDNPLHYTVVPDSHVTTVRIGSHMSALYLYYILKASQKQFEKLGEGSTKQKELKAISLKNYLIPLPPLAEQKRIVAKIEEIWPLVDKLKKA